MLKNSLDSSKLSITLSGKEWVFVEDAVSSWIKYVFSITPNDERADKQSDMANDAQRLEVILKKITEQKS